jgi:Sec-independent protein translocase protein TatA
VGFGTESLFLFVLGFLLLGPKKLPSIIGHIARAKSQLKNATGRLASELEDALETPSHQQGTNPNTQMGGQQ